jgi:hypothetical protein
MSDEITMAAVIVGVILLGYWVWTYYKPLEYEDMIAP